MESRWQWHYETSAVPVVADSVYIYILQPLNNILLFQIIVGNANNKLESLCIKWRGVYILKVRNV